MTLPLDKQVCSLELAKRLKELGVPQDSLFYWWHDQQPGCSDIACLGHDTEADARASLLIHLVEHKLIDPNDH